MSERRRWGWLVLGTVVVALVASCSTERLETTATTTERSTATTDRDRATTSTRARTGTTETTSTTAAGGGTTISLPEESAWSLNAVEFRGRNGFRVTVDCPPDTSGATYTVWGTGTYTDDSSICMAGVHAGKITAAAGGSVTIEIRPGQESYEGSEANGVTSFPYGPWDGSFVFAD